MSEKRIINVLKGFGFSETDYHVYIFLAKKGPCKIQEIVKELNLNERSIYASIEELQSIGIAKFSIEKPLEFAVIPFDDLIDLFIEVEKEQAKTMQKTREEILSSWRKMIKKEIARS
ncbi:MAG: helix-turn-helix domain-containing protein [Candidatus Bathyarchaeota archaeon]|jgi:sugar-specific transcriptional regulator TrmB